MATPEEPDFPPGHPARADYNPNSPEAKEWARIHVHPKGERDFPVDHPFALDTPGNKNAVEIVNGIDPARPDYEEFTGRTPEVAAAVRKINRKLAERAKPTPARQPIIAPAPPKTPGTTVAAPGQPG